MWSATDWDPRSLNHIIGTHMFFQRHRSLTQAGREPGCHRCNRTSSWRPLACLVGLHLPTLPVARRLSEGEADRHDMWLASLLLHDATAEGEWPFRSLAIHTHLKALLAGGNGLPAPPARKRLVFQRSRRLKVSDMFCSESSVSSHLSLFLPSQFPHHPLLLSNFILSKQLYGAVIADFDISLGHQAAV